MFAIFALLFATLAAASGELKVAQYDGPTECDEADKVKVGDNLGMHYTGSIDESSKTGKKGEVFDSSRQRGVFDFQIGVGQVIRGWDEGILGGEGIPPMKVGGKRVLVIPANLGYGDRGAGGGLIPGGATLKFDVELVDAP